MASSIAHLYERPRTWLEGYYGSGWGTRPAEVVDATWRNFALGHKLLTLNGLYDSTRGGWWEWAPPDNHFRGENGWNRYKAVLARPQARPVKVAIRAEQERGYTRGRRSPGRCSSTAGPGGWRRATGPGWRGCRRIPAGPGTGGR